jgi:hypothetical protein
MAEAGITDSVANSPAKQMLAALTRASQDMTRTVNESCEYIESLNAALESKVNEHLKEINGYAELVIRGQLTGISQEKDGILIELSELQREELKVLQGIGKKLRDEMSTRLDEIVSEIAGQLDGKLSGFQEKLAAAEKESESKVTLALDKFRESLPGRIKEIESKSNEEASRLGDLKTQHDEFFNAEIAETISRFQEKINEVKAQIEKDDSAYREAVDGKFEHLNELSGAKLDECLDGISDLREEVVRRIRSLSEADVNYIKSIPEPFTKAIKQSSEIQSDLQSTVTKNLALEYRTEILTLSKETEDLVQRARAELHVALNAQRDQFAGQADKLVLDFEKSLRELPINKDKQKGLEKDSPAQVKQIIEDLRTKIREAADKKFHEAQELVEKSYDETHTDLNAIGRQVTEHIESSLQALEDESAAVQKENEKSFEALMEKMQSMELLVDEARQLISALGDAGLEFDA